ncbi:MAG: Rpn family recombination-promoting nuclease/putative transposase, partial [Rickettsiales bacterium]|nr:Rpn family recombination-promoting nuclease/putative transposase [Rickettsiales bacterium]
PVEIVTKKFRRFITELSKIEYKNIYRADMLHVWMTFKERPEFIPDEFLGIPEVKEAMDELTLMSYGREFVEEYGARRKILNDERSALTVAKEEGLKKGKEEGLKEGKISTALSMLEDNMPIATIVKYTGLSEDEIKSLKSGR